MSNNITEEKVIELLQEVYDPDMPVIDIYNLWLIYNVDIQENNVFILMTLTTPACPSADLIIEMTKQAVQDEFPESNVEVELTFDPMRTPAMIKDEDLKRMFE